MSSAGWLCRICAAVLVLWSAVLPAHAVSPDEVLKDPALETRARKLSAELRCLVCQNQSIDDSDAPLAKDLRVLVRERLKNGDSDKQVIDYIVARYGEFVLLRPRFGIHTLLLWLAPFAVLLLAGLFVYSRTRRRAGERNAPEPLNPEEQARLKQILDNSKA
ncbi:MAG: hypothetical protein RLZ98_997 [Pseudomonadota bacterium]|jgi:cytochrome c-type biogenesis protein CcmH